MLKDELNKFGEDLVRNTRSKLSQKGKNVSGVLMDSIRYEVVPTEEGFILEFWMMEYGYYQDEGVRGADPSAFKYAETGKTGKQKAPNSRFHFGSGKGKGSLFKGLDGWIVRKGLAPRKNNRFTSRKSMKYAMARSIYLQGIEPSGFFTEAWNETLGTIDEDLAKGIAEEAEKLYF